MTHADSSVDLKNENDYLEREVTVWCAVLRKACTNMQTLNTINIDGLGMFWGPLAVCVKAE